MKSEAINQVFVKIITTFDLFLFFLVAKECVAELQRRIFEDFRKGYLKNLL